jgi:phage baseplate assembly protein W
MVATPLTKKRVLYADFGRDLVQHPVTADVSRKINEDAVKESIRNLVLTDRGERPFRPNIGCDVRKLLFGNFMPETGLLIKEAIISTISAYEPRAEIIAVNVDPRPDNNAFSVSITFRVINSVEATRLDLVLNRIR